MKKQPTPEQIEERQARIKLLRDYIKTTTPEQREELAIKYGIVNPEGHRLSGTNSVLIAFQLPTFSIVAGYQQWKKNGRQVRKGEHGAIIWIPCNTPKDSEDIEDNSEMFFRTVTVFDISQTEEISIQVAA